MYYDIFSKVIQRRFGRIVPDFSKVNILRAFLVGIFMISMLGLLSPVRTLIHEPENIINPSDSSGARIYQSFEYVEITKRPNYTIPLAAIASLSLIAVILSYVKIGVFNDNEQSINKRKRSNARICRTPKNNIQ